jgi:hypothetical protein
MPRSTSVVRVPKAGEMIAAQLRRQIVTGQLHEGQALPSETELMTQYGVSRPTLRGRSGFWSRNRLFISGAVLAAVLGWLFQTPR